MKQRAVMHILIWVVSLCGIAPLSTAQDRSLSWDALTVHARLDADGVLYVTERHAMVFDGAWNGGERSFQLRPWHRLELKSFGEIDLASQTRTLWSEGDLDQVGDYQRSGDVLRWRARMPDDQPFANALKTYEISYSLFGILIPDNGAYRLEHNLAFPDRSGEIRVFDATLEFDPVWDASAVPTTWHHEHLQPGESVFVTASLQYLGAGKPAEVATAAAVPSTSGSLTLRYSLAALVLFFAIAHTLALFKRERAAGRFEPGLPLSQIDEAWLEAHVFNRPPEVVGAAWDRDTSASEVAALLARLAQQGAIKTEVRKSGSGWFARDTLHMELLCERNTLALHERKLIDALFFGGSRITDTTRIREHYSTKGFTPAGLITPSIEKQLPVIFNSGIGIPLAARLVTAFLLIAGIVVGVIGAVRAPSAAPWIVATTVVLLACWIFALVFGYGYRSSVHELRGRLTRALVCSYLLCAVVAFVLLAGVVPMVAPGMVAVALFALAFLNSAFNNMRIREIRESLQLRRLLGSARMYFEQELRSKSPRLKDEWFPYLLAFGLGPKIDRWFKSFGGETRSMSSSMRSGTMTSDTVASHAGTSSGGSAWTGGGGTFGGAGATASWAGAVSGIAAGVAKPSSSSSSGSSGGSSSSSGGGGGGGW